MSSHNIDLCLTDSTSNCVCALSLLEEIYPHLLAGPCAPHCVDLAVEDTARGKLVGSIVLDMREVVEYFCIHGHLYAKFKSRVKK